MYVNGDWLFTDWAVMADRREADMPAASAAKQTGSCTSYVDRDVQPTCTCTNVCRAATGHDKTHSVVDKVAKSLGDNCVIGHQNFCYSQSARHGDIGDTPLGGHTDWTPMPVSSSNPCGDAASVCECEKAGSLSEDVRLQQWRAAGIALKHALNHIARSADCTCDGARSDVASASVSGASEGRTATDAMNEMLEQFKGTPHDEGSNEPRIEHETLGQACGSCGRANGDSKPDYCHDKGGAASTVDSGDAPVNLQLLRERIRLITQKLPTSTDQSDHTSARRQHQSCKVTRQRHMADTDDSDVNDLCSSRKHDKEARKHVKVSRRRSSAGGKTAVSPSCIAEGEEQNAAATLSESSTDPGIVVRAAELTGTVTCQTSHCEATASDHTCREAEDSVGKHSPHARSAILPVSRPRGLAEADSIANLADIESCTESFDVTEEKSSDEREPYATSSTAVGWCDTLRGGSSHDASHDAIDGSSHCKDNNAVGAPFETPLHGTSQGKW